MSGLLTGAKAVLSKSHIRESDHAAWVGIPGQEVPEEHFPTVELTRDGDVIKAIHITCTCGEEIRLRCVYPDTPR